MKHLEDMDHMRQGIHWISVGQRDPLVEYRRQAQIMFETMQERLRRDVVRTIFAAQPVSEEQLEKPAETALTRAARRSVSNADKILEAEEFNEGDFAKARSNAGPIATVEKPSATKRTEKKTTRTKKRKAERKRRKKGRRK